MIIIPVVSPKGIIIGKVVFPINSNMAKKRRNTTYESRLILVMHSVYNQYMIFRAADYSRTWIIICYNNNRLIFRMFPTASSKSTHYSRVSDICSLVAYDVISTFITGPNQGPEQIIGEINNHNSMLRTMMSNYLLLCVILTSHRAYGKMLSS